MADSRTVRKRDGQVKTITDFVAKGHNIIENSERSRNPAKEVLALVKNIRQKKISVDELNEEILNFVDEEQIATEITTSSDLDVFIDTELEILEDYLALSHRLKNRVSLGPIGTKGISAIHTKSRE